jgi:hypothetical protein
MLAALAKVKHGQGGNLVAGRGPKKHRGSGHGESFILQRRFRIVSGKFSKSRWRMIMVCG